VGHYRGKFPFFFDDFEHRYQSGEDFQYQILSNMECLILPPHAEGDSTSIVMNPTDSVDYLYFVHLGTVNVFDRSDRFLVKYLAGTFFGDFQLLLGLRANYRYVGSANRTNYLFQVKGSVFLRALYADYDAMVYLSKIALQRRKYLRGKVR
jgi:signal-transduction protein with cAMP-binding, CBS, and nucleotidyltransferase domain